MYIRKPQPITVAPMGKVCPVCGYTSYSRGGVHPQCSALRRIGRCLPRGVAVGRRKKPAESKL